MSDRGSGARGGTRTLDRARLSGDDLRVAEWDAEDRALSASIASGGLRRTGGGGGAAATGGALGGGGGLSASDPLLDTLEGMGAGSGSGLGGSLGVGSLRLALTASEKKVEEQKLRIRELKTQLEEERAKSRSEITRLRETAVSQKKTTSEAKAVAEDASRVARDHVEATSASYSQQVASILTHNQRLLTQQLELVAAVPRSLRVSSDALASAADVEVRVRREEDAKRRRDVFNALAGARAEQEAERQRLTATIRDLEAERASLTRQLEELVAYAHAREAAFVSELRTVWDFGAALANIVRDVQDGVFPVEHAANGRRAFRIPPSLLPADPFAVHPTGLILLRGLVGDGARSVVPAARNLGTTGLGASAGEVTMTATATGEGIGSSSSSASGVRPSTAAAPSGSSAATTRPRSATSTSGSRSARTGFAPSATFAWDAVARAGGTGRKKDESADVRHLDGGGGGEGRGSGLDGALDSSDDEHEDRRGRRLGSEEGKRGGHAGRPRTAGARVEDEDEEDARSVGARLASLEAEFNARAQVGEVDMETDVMKMDADTLRAQLRTLRAFVAGGLRERTEEQVLNDLAEQPALDFVRRLQLERDAARVRLSEERARAKDLRVAHRAAERRLDAVDRTGGGSDSAPTSTLGAGGGVEGARPKTPGVLPGVSVGFGATSGEPRPVSRGGRPMTAGSERPGSGLLGSASAGSLHPTTLLASQRGPYVPRHGGMTLRPEERGGVMARGMDETLARSVAHAEVRSGRKMG